MEAKKTFIIPPGDLITIKKYMPLYNIADPKIIKVVIASDNKLNTGEGFEKFINLKELYLNKNALKSLKVLPLLPKLKILNAKANALSSLQETLLLIKDKVKEYSVSVIKLTRYSRESYNGIREGLQCIR